MVKTILVEKNINDGKRLIEEIDKSGIELTAAFWFYLPDTDEWRLMFAMPLVDEEGPRKGYEEISKIIDKVRSEIEISSLDISVIGKEEKIIKTLRAAIKTKKTDISGIRYTGNVIDGTLIEDVFIYRMT